MYTFYEKSKLTLLLGFNKIKLPQHYCKCCKGEVQFYWAYLNYTFNVHVSEIEVKDVFHQTSDRSKCTGTLPFES